MSQREAIKAPSKLDTALDAFRAIKDVASLVKKREFLKNAPKGDGHTVMVLPGFMTSDPATTFLRKQLRKFGYNAQPWKLGVNLGPTNNRDIDTLLHERVKELYLTSGHRISLVGWSLGGVLAREVARNNPEMIRQVITLASPVGGSMEATSLWDIYIKLFGRNINKEALEERMEKVRHPVPGVAFTSIYTKQDGVIAWQLAQVDETDLSQNIAVGASHLGIIFNPQALYAIADRLSMPDNQWKRMDEEMLSLLT